MPIRRMCHDALKSFSAAIRKLTATRAATARGTALRIGVHNKPNAPERSKQVLLNVAKLADDAQRSGGFLSWPRRGNGPGVSGMASQI